MTTLGGSIFTHNAFKYDYCIKESLASLLELCDEVVCLDADSDDGTLVYLNSINNPKLKIIKGVWNQHVDGQPHYDRLRILANQAREALNTDWHFMLQADEVIHEDSFHVIRNVINMQDYNSIRCLRLNLWGDLDHYIDPKNANKPCGDYIFRLAKKELPAIGDAESLTQDKCLTNFSDKILIYHYGMVRNPYIFVDKVIDMGMWFWNGSPDPRYVALKEKNKRFVPNEIQSDLRLLSLPKNHPKFVTKWVEERRDFYR